MGGEPFSIRLGKETRAALAEDARRYGVPERTLAQQLIDEGIRLRRHPGIVFVTRVGGRRAALAPRPRLSVANVIETLRGSDSPEAAAGSLALSAAHFRVALDYYREHRAEVDAEIARNAEEAERAEREFRERQELLRR